MPNENEGLQSNSVADAGFIDTDIPARLDSLPWSRFHLLCVVALGITWVLDGLEVTLAGSLAGALKESPTLHLTEAQVGASASAYLAGAVLGALVFGYLGDRLGRRYLFYVTLTLYTAATALSGISWDFLSFAFFRFCTGAGIGGEYTAINSAIQELTPARLRGRVDLTINGSFWVGAAAGAVGSALLLDSGLFSVDVGWRLAFGIGASLGVLILLMRRFLPESPRWLLTHGFPEEAERVVSEIETRVAESHPVRPIEERESYPLVRIYKRDHSGFGPVVRTLIHEYPRRTALGVILMVSQAFLYNAIFFTYALILLKFYNVPASQAGWHILPFAAGNFLGPLLLGRLFDTLGRKQMIAGTYALAGVLLAISGALFVGHMLTLTAQTTAWTVIFFFASAAASSAYLTVGESFPLEIRASAIAVFYAVGTGAGGVAAPWFFGVLIESGSRVGIFEGYLIGAAMMIAAAVAEAWLGVAAERRSLESVAPPLSSVER